MMPRSRSIGRNWSACGSSVQADKEPLNWIYPIYVHNIRLPAFGEYIFDILRDRRLVYRHSFHLRQDEEIETRR